MIVIDPQMFISIVNLIDKSVSCDIKIDKVIVVVNDITGDKDDCY